MARTKNTGGTQVAATGSVTASQSRRGRTPTAAAAAGTTRPKAKAAKTKPVGKRGTAAVKPAAAKRPAGDTEVDADVVDLDIDPEIGIVDEEAANDEGSDDFGDIDDVELDEDLSIGSDMAAAAEGIVLVPLTREDDDGDDEVVSADDHESDLGEDLAARLHLATDAAGDDEDDDFDAAPVAATRLTRRAVTVDDEDDDDDDEPLDLRPSEAHEFICQACFLIKHRAQLADAAEMICADCA